MPPRMIFRLTSVWLLGGRQSGMKVKEELRQRALTWLLVLDYVEQGVEGLGGAADMPEDAMEIVSPWASSTRRACMPFRLPCRD